MKGGAMKGSAMKGGALMARRAGTKFHLTYQRRNPDA
jgi:hypothetical protein